MTEKEYIHVTDLRTVRHIINGLRDLIPENNESIIRSEYLEVFNLVQAWEKRLEQKIHIR